MPKKLWTVEQAREMGRRSAIITAQRRANQLTEPSPTDVVLLNVHRQLVRVHELIMRERDASALERLAATEERLMEVERIVSGRPDPGTIRPGTKAPRQREIDAMPLA